MDKILKLGIDNGYIAIVLGLCPLIIVVTNVTTGIAIGIVFLLTLVLTSLCISCLRNLLPSEIRFIVILFISSTVVSIVSLGMQYLFYPLSEALGFYVLLIAVNCLILVFAEEISLRHPPGYSFINSLHVGAGILLILILIGIIREISGSGTILKEAELLFGDMAQSWTLQIFDGPGFILMKHVPGMFIILGLFIAIKNYMLLRLTSPEPRAPSEFE